MEVIFGIIIGGFLILGIGLIVLGIWGKKNAISELQESDSSDLLYAGIAIIIFVGAGLMISRIEQPKKISEVQSETEDTREVSVTTDNIVYTNGEVTEKLRNRIILVSVHEETYKILVEQDVYDSLEKGDEIGCIAYLDGNNNIVGVNYFAK